MKLPVTKGVLDADATNAQNTLVTGTDYLSVAHTATCCVVVPLTMKGLDYLLRVAARTNGVDPEAFSLKGDCLRLIAFYLSKIAALP